MFVCPFGVAERVQRSSVVKHSAIRTPGADDLEVEDEAFNLLVDGFRAFPGDPRVPFVPHCTRW